MLEHLENGAQYICLKVVLIKKIYSDNMMKFLWWLHVNSPQLNLMKNEKLTFTHSD